MFNPEISGLNSVEKLREKGRIKEALHLLSELEQKENLSHKELLSFKLVKANLLRGLGNHFEAIEIAKKIFQEFQKLRDYKSAFDSLLIQAYSYMIMTNISKSEDIISQAEDLFRIIKATSSIDLRERESFFIRIKAGIHSSKGDIQKSLELNKEAYELAKDIGDPVLISASLNNIAHVFHDMKEYDKASKYAQQAVKINNNLTLAVSLSTLIEISVSKGNIRKAKDYLNRLREHSERFDSKWNKTMYYSAKALILKLSIRSRDRIKSEDIYKRLALDNTITGESRINAIINLCDLCLTELRITNDIEIISEIHHYIQKLLNIAEKEKLFSILAETYILQAKLSLLTLDINDAKRFLTQAQKIADSNGIKRLAMKISHEHDEILRQAEMWENLKLSKVPISERWKIVGLGEQIERMVKKRMIEVPKLSYEEPILLLILSEGGVPLFSHSFIQDKTFEAHLFGGFLSTIDYFINEIFSEGLDRAVFGEHTLLMKSIPPFIISYIFKGDSYYALQKLDHFKNRLQTEGKIWTSLLRNHERNTTIQLKDNPKLEFLINETFIDKNPVLS